MSALAILNAHVAEFSYPEWRCSCGWRKDYATTPFAEQHRRHLAQLLAVPVPDPSTGARRGSRSMGSERHRVKLSLDQGDLMVEVICPHDLADVTRPCWARLEDGSVDPDGERYCNFREWQGNAEGGCLGNTTLGEWEITPRWESFDCLFLDLGGVSG